VTTHIIAITDMSGSMFSVAEDVRGGFNTYIAALDRDTPYTVTAVVFDTVVENLCVGFAPDDVPEMTVDNYSPRGNTALYDSIGQAVAAFNKRIPVLPDGDRVMVVIQTDGRENSSHEWTSAAVKALITEREATGLWSFTYIGLGFDDWNQAAGIGISLDSYVVHTNSSRDSARTMTGLSRGTARYAAGAGGQSVAASITEELQTD
jgi:hypothetical protein